jgi:hypothetical protein
MVAPEEQKIRLTRIRLDVLRNSGAHDADRTHDLSLTKGVLYH